MTSGTLQRELEEGLSELPIIDAHTHLIGSELGARGLHEILLYHMLISDLYGAGVPSGKRLTEFPGAPDKAEAHARIQEALPYLPHIRNTAMYWLNKVVLKDLYGFEGDITADNWRKLDDQIRERAGDRAWHLSILDRIHVKRTCAEYARRGEGKSDDRLQYSLEWGFFTRSQWGEFDTALYELERCWGKQPQGSTPIGAGARPATEKTIKSIDDVHAAIDWYVNAIPYERLVSMATHLSTDIEYGVISDDEMNKALANRAHAGMAERSVYAGYVQEAFLTALEPHADELVFQFSFGAEPLPFESGSRLNQRTIGQVADMIARHPKLRFQCFLSSRHANQSLCTMVRELPNFSLAGFWWHNFFPSVISQVMDERLDMVPANKQVGFFSDAYCVDWVYGKWFLVRRLLAQALAARIERGQYSKDDAMAVARAILYDSPQTLLGLKPIA